MYLSVIGTRPQIMKVDFEWTADHKTIWTGQHYDYMMKDVFFQDVDIGGFDYELDTKNLITMIQRIRKIIRKEKPNAVLVYGDCRSTLAGAIAASDLDVPVVHIEAGMRAYRRDMPEERIRVMVDHMSSYRLCVDLESVDNLEREGLHINNAVVGNTMFDSFNTFCPIKKKENYHKYSYLSIHRQENADSAVRLENIFEALEESKEKFIFPIHPRTQKTIDKHDIDVPKNVEIIKPQGYRNNLHLISNARRVLTDSGGVQSEAYFMGVPCGVLRRETEWKGYVRDGWSVLVDDDATDIQKFLDKRFMLASPRPSMPHFGAKSRIKELIYTKYGT